MKADLSDVYARMGLFFCLKMETKRYSCIRRFTGHRSKKQAASEDTACIKINYYFTS